jgi:hypothetical protein
MEHERYCKIKAECRAYNLRRDIIRFGRADPVIIESSKKLNEAIDRAIDGCKLSEREAEEYREDLIYNRGWCKSALCEMIHPETYAYHKRKFCEAIAAALGI